MNMHVAVNFLLGLLFGLGLLVSGMTDPGKVQGFLDIAGRWDPSLALVMGAAVGVGVVGFAWARGRAARRTDALGAGDGRDSMAGGLGAPFVDRRVVLGSAVFGVGWGLGGFCPGPAVVSAGAGAMEALLFVAAMLLGMWIHDRR